MGRASTGTDTPGCGRDSLGYRVRPSVAAAVGNASGGDVRGTSEHHPRGTDNDRVEWLVGTVRSSRSETRAETVPGELAEP